MSKKLKKIAFLSALALAMGLPVAGGAQARGYVGHNAFYNRGFYGAGFHHGFVGHGYYNNFYNRGFYGFNNYYPFRYMGYNLGYPFYYSNFPAINLYTSTGYFDRYNLWDVYPSFRNTFSDVLGAQRVVLINGMNSNQIIISNGTSGTSVNQVVVTVDDNLYNSLVNGFSANQNLQLQINTTDNTITLNTLDGTPITGSATITVQ